MNRQEINNAIINYLNNYNPERIGIFGSFARQEETPESDIDILVKFHDTISLLGKKVDLVTEPALRNTKLKKYIFNDLKIIY